MKKLHMLAGVLVVALCWVIYDATRERIITTGDKAPAFAVTTDTGKKIARGDFGGKVLVLNFWATWCPPCIEELPSLNAMQGRLAQKGVVVLGVSVDKNEQKYKAFLKRAGIQFETSRDPEANISASYGTYKYPETYIIDRSGKVVQKHIGNKDWMDPELLKSIEALL